MVEVDAGELTGDWVDRQPQVVLMMCMGAGRTGLHQKEVNQPPMGIQGSLSR